MAGLPAPEPPPAIFRYSLMMDTKDLFAAALSLKEPWFTSSVELLVEQRTLEIGIDFRRGGTFECPECGKLAKAYDTEERQWRHLNFFEFKTTLTARVPRVDCADHGVKPISPPWARPGSGFTLLFEALLVTMAQHMPVAAVARMLGEHDTRLWRVLHAYVDAARRDRDDSQVCVIGIDETATRRGHNYVSLVVDLEKSRVLEVFEGRSAAVVSQFADSLRSHGGDPESITEVCCDMSLAFIRGITDHLPHASITFDRFHVMHLLSNAVDQTRRSERKQLPALKGFRFALLRNPETLNEKERLFTTDLLKKSTSKTSRAYQLRLAFREFYNQEAADAEGFLQSWYSWAIRSRIPAMVEVARTVKRRWDGILRWFQSRITNGLLEGINSLVQAAKAKARGYRTIRNLTTIIFLIAGKLDLRLPSLHTSFP
jgi:transposase